MIFNQQRYMGASIRSFNASIGWGNSCSHLDVNLVEDNYYNQLGNLLTGETFTPVEVGLPTIFRFSGFNDDELNLSVGVGNYVEWSFAGIVKGYRQENSTNGNPLFSVSVEDPREILGGTQLILDDYFGSVSGIPNVLNVFGAVEDIMGLNSNTPGYTNNYGGMQRNPTGTPWWIIRDAVHYMTSGILSQHYGTFLKLKNRKYSVNLSDLPQTLSSGYRIFPTDNMSLMDYVSDVCEAASYDYYVTLNPLYYSNGSLVLDEQLLPINEIKVNTVSREYLPQPSSIINFISSTSGAIAKNIGVEFRNETNAKFLLGGNLLSMYRVEDSGYLEENGLPYTIDNIHQFYGTNSVNGSLLTEIRPSVDALIGKKKRANPIVVIDTRDLDNNIYPYDYYYTDINELRACLSSIDAWQDYLSQTEMYKFIPINNEDEQWLVNKGINIEEGVLSEYFRKFDGTKIKDNRFPLEVFIFPENQNAPINTPVSFPVTLNTPVVQAWDGAAFVPLRQQFTGSSAFRIRYETGSPYDSHFKAVLLNNAPSPNEPLLSEGTTIANNASYLSLEKEGSPFTINNSNMPNQLVQAWILWVYLPVDKDGYSHSIRWNTDKNFTPGGNIPWVFSNGENLRYVTYKHTRVANVHYKKYHSLLRLSGGTNQKEMIDILVQLNDYANNPNTPNSRAKLTNIAKSLEISKLDVIKQEENNMRIQAFYDFLNQYARNIGTKYIVNMPQMLVTRDATGSGILTSISPVNEGFFTEEDFDVAVTNGWLPYNYYKLTNEQNLVSPYAFYPSAHLYNFTSFQDNDILYSYDINGLRKDAYIKCTVDEPVYFIYKPSGLYPKAVINLPGLVHYKEEFDTQSSLGTMGFIANLTGVLAGNHTNNVGADDLFEFMCAKPIQPQFVAIPVQSNVSSYGPWWNIGATGMIEYERDESLVPWNYGGFSGLNLAANSRVSEVAIQQQDENGSVEFPGIPSIPLGNQLEWISNGSTYYGPYITDINVDFGEGGIKTAYKMQTWTPKFGKLAKQYEDSVQKFGKEAIQSKRMGDERRKTGFNQKISKVFELYNTIVKDGELKTQKSLGRSLRRASSHEILAGQTDASINEGNARFQTIVVNQPTYNTSTQVSEDYINKAFTSLDGIYRPYSTYYLHSGNLPHYEELNTVYKDFAYNSFDTSNEVFPFPNGHDINVFTMDEQIPSHGLINNGSNYSKDKNYRSLGFKLPAIYIGYGRNVNGKPVPNAGLYEYDASGNYLISSSGNEDSDYFADDYLNRSDMWKAGPFDNRWDSRKKMWVAGSLLVEGYLVEDLAPAEGRFSSVPFTSGRMILCGGTYANVESGYQPKVWDRADASGYYASGLLKNGESGILWHSSGDYYASFGGLPSSGGNHDLFVLLINRSTQVSAPSGTYIIASPMPNGDYRPIWIDCQPSERDGIE